ncbi:MAG: hypothetical protein E5Y69_06380 [Mesorhizobium sp.]|nr:MAG: hypothetical protein E5Y69_06380 [Mesorhizobium sp.]
MQMVVVVLSGSVALLADTIHNIGDATTAIPLWIAFILARRKPSPTFPYGLGRVEDLAGIIIVGIILFIGALGVWLGFPLADPIVGLLITLAIFGIVWQSARSVLTRMLDGIEPEVIGEIHHAAAHVPGARIVDAKARWIGHKLHADIAVAVEESLPVSEAKKITAALEAELFDHMPALAAANIRLARADAAHPHEHGHGEHRH